MSENKSMLRAAGTVLVVATVFFTTVALSTSRARLSNNTIYSEEYLVCNVSAQHGALRCSTQ